MRGRRWNIKKRIWADAQKNWKIKEELMMTYSEMIKQAGATLSPEAEAILASLQNREHETQSRQATLLKIRTTIAAAFGDNFSSVVTPITVLITSEGVVADFVEPKTVNGAGHRRFGGGNGAKVRGPFTDGNTEYADWHTAAVVYGHKCAD